MSVERVTKLETSKLIHESNIQSKKVDINILLSRVRADEKKEQLESNVFFGLIAVAVIVTGVIASL